jgi:hypothetical protein
VRRLDGHDVHLGVCGKSVGKDAIGTSRLGHPNKKIEDSL